MVIKNIAQAIGRRKTSVARIYVREGKGEIVINGKPMTEYFTVGAHQDVIMRPFNVTDTAGKYKILINVKGGGITGQAEACLHGIARALVEVDESNKASLKANGFLTRDSRMVERKKYGQKGARRKFQFSKR